MTTEKPLSRTNAPLTSCLPSHHSLPTPYFLFLSIFPKRMSRALPRIGELPSGPRSLAGPSQLCDGRGDGLLPLPALSAPALACGAVVRQAQAPWGPPGALFGPEKTQPSGTDPGLRGACGWRVRTWGKRWTPTSSVEPREEKGGAWPHTQESWLSLFSDSSANTLALGEVPARAWGHGRHFRSWQ